MDEVRSVLFGLEGFDVVDAVETADGLGEVWVETTDPVLGCPSCGTPAGRSSRCGISARRVVVCASGGASTATSVPIRTVIAGRSLNNTQRSVRDDGPRRGVEHGSAHRSARKAAPCRR